MFQSSAQAWSIRKLTMQPLKAEQEEICHRGETIYRHELQQILDNDENSGKVLVIDIDTKDFEMDQDQVAASRRLRERRPDARRYVLRIGYPSLYKVAGSWATTEHR